MHSADHSTDTFFFSLLFFLRFTLYLGEDVSHSTLSSLLYSTVTGLTFSQSVASQNLPDHGPQVEWKTLMLFTVMGSFLHETHHLYKLPICTEMPSLLKLHVWKKEVKWILYSDRSQELPDELLDPKQEIYSEKQIQLDIFFVPFIETNLWKFSLWLLQKIQFPLGFHPI